MYTSITIHKGRKAKVAKIGKKVRKPFLELIACCLLGIGLLSAAWLPFWSAAFWLAAFWWLPL